MLVTYFVYCAHLYMLKAHIYVFIYSIFLALYIVANLCF